MLCDLAFRMWIENSWVWHMCNETVGSEYFRHVILFHTFLGFLLNG
jgi:hypothetical protein